MWPGAWNGDAVRARSTGAGAGQLLPGGAPGRPAPLATPGVASASAKLALCGGGLALLGSVSHSVWAPAVLLGVALVSHGVARLLRAMPAGRWHALVARLAVPAAFCLVVLLNVSGMIGTLTGAGSTLQAGASPLLVALPFYLLSAAAFVAEMAQARRVMPLPRLLDLLVYVLLPFKLLAGPLEPPQLLAQIRDFMPRLRSSRLMVAWSWIVLGAFMKYVIANRLDPARNLAAIDPVASFVTAAVFELKFYFDFAGYSFMAHGACLAIGLRITQNFNHPFLAPNVVLFWRCWHMSLGRFLARYVLEPNLSLWKGRQQKMLFASAIFLVSAMWHGGTLNYLLWGLFHGAVYYAYGQWFKRRELPGWLGTLAMLQFFVFGRMLAVDADSTRLLQRLLSFLDPTAYRFDVIASADFISAPEGRALAAAAVFLAAEVLSRRWYGQRPYHLLRKPLVCALLLGVFLVSGTDTGALLYARI